MLLADGQKRRCSPRAAADKAEYATLFSLLAAAAIIEIIYAVASHCISPPLLHTPYVIHGHYAIRQD